MGMDGLNLWQSILVIVGFFWAIAGLLLPFFVWGIHSRVTKSAEELQKIRLIAESAAKKAGIVEKEEGVKVGLFD